MRSEHIVPYLPWVSPLKQGILSLSTYHEETQAPEVPV